ncbi:hypothetical protein BACFIN_05645 [Bacteroides finegoldii DSM 17565]|nr:hypothetical protein BACFIN_05645 [Bacteroides finegoldii DSM 17565]
MIDFIFPSYRSLSGFLSGLILHAGPIAGKGRQRQVNKPGI